MDTDKIKKKIMDKNFPFNFADEYDERGRDNAFGWMLSVIQDLIAELADHPYHEACPKCLTRLRATQKREAAAKQRIEELKTALLDKVENRIGQDEALSILSQAEGKIKKIKKIESKGGE